MPSATMICDESEFFYPALCRVRYRLRASVCRFRGNLVVSGFCAMASVAVMMMYEVTLGGRAESAFASESAVE